MPRTLKIGIRRAAPWLVTLTAVICLGAVLRRDTRQRLQIAELGTRLVRVQAEVGSSPPAPRREPARQDALSQALAVGTAQAFADVDPRDHLDGRRDDPGYAFVWHRQQQRIIERQYGDAIAALGLTESASARLKELLTARREAVVDARDAALQAGLAGPEVNLAVEQSVDACTEEIKQLVGSDAYYGQIELAPTVSACKSLLENTVGLDLAAKGNPLTNAQLYALAQNYVEATDGPDPSGGSPAPDAATGLTPRYQALLDRVSGGLNPAQAASVRDFLVEQVQTLRVSGAPSSTLASDR
jgi:hypothetical protein